MSTQPRPKTTHNLVITFDDFQNGKHRVIASCMHSHTREKTKEELKKDKAKKHHTEANPTGKKSKNVIHAFSQSIDIEIGSRAKVAPLLARIEAVGFFLKNAKSNHIIVIRTDDELLLKRSKPPKAQAAIDKLKNKFSQFSIVPTEPEHDEQLENANRNIAFKINDLLKNNKESKGYINRNPAPGRN